MKVIQKNIKMDNSFMVLVYNHGSILGRKMFFEFGVSLFFFFFFTDLKSFTFN